MLATILILFGLAPHGADSNPCLLPSWAIATPLVIACDVKELQVSGVSKNRSGLTFQQGQFNGITLHVATQSSGSNAEKAAMLIGATGGYVTANGVAGAAKAWKADLAPFGFDPAKIPVNAVAFIEFKR